MGLRRRATDGALELDVLTSLMLANGIDLSEIVTAERIGRGQSNLTYMIEDSESRRWVVRRPPLGELLESAHDVQREARILDALAPTDVPVPRVLCTFDDARLAAAPVIVMEHVDGLVVERMDIAEALPLPVRRQLGLELARTLARVHEVDLQQVGLGDLASRSPYAARQLMRWARQWDASKTRERPALEALTAMLHNKMPAQREVALVHGDFHLRNVIADPATGDLRAVLDWELSTLGDPLADIGSLLAYWPSSDDAPTALFAAPTLPGFISRDELMTKYLEASGRDGDDIAYWHVLGLWKIAVISEGVLRRTQADSRNVAEGGPPDTAHIDQLVDRAWEVARLARLYE